MNERTTRTFPLSSYLEAIPSTLSLSSIDPRLGTRDLVSQTHQPRIQALQVPARSLSQPRSESSPRCNNALPERAPEPTLEEEEDEPEISAAVQSHDSPRPVKIMKLESEMKPQSDLLALDVDCSYQAPLERPIKPGKNDEGVESSTTDAPTVACFYVRHRDDVREYYRAVYLMQRTVKDLINGISQKFQIDSHRVTQVTHINSKGLHIIVDEDVVREVPEGQDMLVEFAPFQTGHPVKHEFATHATTDIMVDGILDPADTTISDPFEMWLTY